MARALGRVMAALVLACLGTWALADSARSGRDAFDICASCHGVSGEGNHALDAPRIAGLDASYLERQLRAFRQGRRGGNPADRAGSQMAAMAATLPDETALMRVAEYVAEVSTGAAPPSVHGNVRAGHDLYAQCAGCHGQKGEGNKQLGAPRLAGMSDWYLLRQLRALQSGLRGGNAADTPGATMKAVAASLPGDSAAQDVIA